MTYYRLVILIITFVFANTVFAYDNFVAHVNISNAAIAVLNDVRGEEQLSDQESLWVSMGAMAEDEDPRYLNHFYDPTTGKGLTDKFKGISAKEWAQHQDGVKLSTLSGNYSESAILKNYRDKNFKRAYQGVGHILHLVQDMSVPAHTRNDEHYEGDPYEKWSKKYGGIDHVGISSIPVDGLDQIFTSLANYSHNNFFSIDTTVGNLTIFEIQEQDGIKYLVNNLDGKEYKLCIVDDSSIKLICKIRLEDSAVHSDYWNLLAPKAVAYSAGVIEYFENKFAEIDAEEKQKLGFLDKTSKAIAGVGGNAAYSLGDSNIVLQAGYILSKDIVVTVGTVAVNTTVGAFTALYQTTVAIASAGYHASVALGNGIINTTVAVGGAIGNTVVGIGSFTRDAVSGLFSGNPGPSGSNTASIIGALQDPLPPSHVVTPSIPPPPPAPQMIITPSNNFQPPFGQAPPPPQVPIVPTGAFQAPQTSSRLATTGAGSGGGGQQPMSFGGGSTQQEAPQNSPATTAEPTENPTATSTEPAVIPDGIVSATTSAPIYAINPVVFSGEYHNSTSTFDAINIELKNTTLDTATTSEIILVQATTTDEILSFNKEVDIPTSGIWQYRVRLENTDNASTTPWSIFNYFETNFATTTATGTLPVATTTYVMVFETPNPANILYSDLNQNNIADGEEENVVASSSTWLAAGEYVFNNLTITNNAIITAAGNENSSSTFKGVKIFAKNLTIETGATISANKQGSGLVSVDGSAIKPLGLGSAGGGGAVRIVITDTLLLNGSITSNGVWFESSGGSIYVTTNTLTGQGSFVSQGGDTVWPSWTPGVGGRISVHYGQSSFTGGAVAPGGRICFDGCRSGGSGTVVLLDVTNNDLYLKSSFKFQKNDEPHNFHNIYISNGASVEIEKGATLTADNISLVGSSRLTVSDGVTVNANNVSAVGGSFVTLGTNVVMNVPVIIIEQKSNLLLLSEEPIVFNSLILKDEATITSGVGRVLFLTVVNLEIGAGSSVSAWTDFAGNDDDTFLVSGVGASVYIKSSGKFINNGSVSTNGPAGKIGGSIYVEANELEGFGTFASAGGSMVWCGWDCGFVIPSGGRVAVYYITSSFNGVAVAPGACGTPDGGFLATCGGNGKVVMDNISNKPAVLPPPPPLSSQKLITEFNIIVATSTITGVVDETAHAISLSVPFSTDVTALVPTITVSTLATSSPASLEPQDFTNPVTYTITAEDGSTQPYVVTVVVEVPPVVVLPMISSYTFNGVAGDIVVDFATTTPTVELSLVASKDVDWVSVTIEEQADSSKDKIFYSGAGCVDGTATCIKTWNGVLSGATSTAAIGTYRIKAHIKDADGNDFNDYLSPYSIILSRSE